MPELAGIKLDSALVLAPLAGYSDLPFRLLCREHGAGLVFTEMISCHGLVYGQQKTLELLATAPEERPLGVQLFGADPVVMGEAAAMVSTRSVDLIDINMGCPVRKVTRRGAGAAMMRTMDLARAVIEAVCRSATVPVTVKFRAGPDAEHLIAADFGAMAEAAGVAAMTVHGRTWAQGFGGLADWDLIGAVKQRVRVAVIGNGDVLGFQDGRRMMAATGCDAVMIGRGALGNPWAFAPEGRPVRAASRFRGLARHLELAARFLHPDRVLFRLKNHAGRYAAGLHGAAEFRRRVYDCPDFAAMEALVASLAAGQEKAGIGDDDGSG